jgi:hypothetical protein
VSIGTHSVIRATCYLLALSVSPSASLAQQLDLDALYAQAAAEGVLSLSQIRSAHIDDAIRPGRGG